MRLKVEIAQMQRHKPDFQLYKQDGTGSLAWCGSLWSNGRVHRDVRLVYSPNHPYSPMTVYVLSPKLPKVNIHIHEDGSICYIYSSDWSPEWTALAVLLTVQRFLDEFYRGLMS